MSYSKFARLEHRVYLELKKKKLKNKDFSLISSNCNGAAILHDLGIRFNSPTVNLYILPDDFLKICHNPQKYFSSVPVEVESEMDFPVGVIDDVTIYFMHYSSFEEAKEKWVERSARINYDNIYFMMTDKNDCTVNNLTEFDSLPIEHKVVFTHKPYPDFKSACYIKGFEDKKEVGVLSDWKPGKLKRRYLDDFDYVSFLNSK